MSERFKTPGNATAPDRSAAVAALNCDAGKDESTSSAPIQWQQHFGGKIIRFEDLAKCGDEVWIEHDGQLYRLQKTRRGKLLLSK